MELLGSLPVLHCMWRYEALRRVALFVGLSDAQRGAIAEAMESVEVPKGETVVAQVRRGAVAGPYVGRPGCRLLQQAVGSVEGEAGKAQAGGGL